MPNPRDKHPARPEDGPERDHSSRPAPMDVPPFPAFGEPAPDFSIPPFATLPSFPNLSSEEAPAPGKIESGQSAAPIPATATSNFEFPPLPFFAIEPNPIFPSQTEAEARISEEEPLFPPLESNADLQPPSSPSEPASGPSPSPWEALAIPNVATPHPSPSLALPAAPPVPPSPPRSGRRARRKSHLAKRRLAASLATPLIGALILVSWLVKLPDVVIAPITVSGLKSSAPVVPLRDGILTKLLVDEQEHVSKDQIIAFIENNSEPESVFRVAAEVDKLRPFLDDEAAFIDLKLGFETALGDLGDTYSRFYAEYNQYRTTLADNYTEETVASLEKQLERKRDQIALVREQADASTREIELSEQKYERMKALFRSRTISISELQEQERAYLAQKRLGASASQSAVEESIALSNIEIEIRELRRGRTEALRNSRDALCETLRILIDSIGTWKTEFVLRAPEAGVIVFYEYWREQRQVREGREAFLVIPETSPLIGRIRVDKKRAGKIHDGQQVSIRLDGFPHREYGAVPGTVESVSTVPLNDAYLISVKLDYPLVTSEGRALTFRQDMAGEASIFTAEIRLVDRILSKVREVFIDTTARS